MSAYGDSGHTTVHARLENQPCEEGPVADCTPGVQSSIPEWWEGAIELWGIHGHLFNIGDSCYGVEAA